MRYRRAQCGVDFENLGASTTARSWSKTAASPPIGSRTRDENEGAKRPRRMLKSWISATRRRSGLCRRARSSALCRRPRAGFCRAATRRDSSARHALYGRAHARGAARPRSFLRNYLRPRLRTILAHGTTTLETKTGYALHKPAKSALLDFVADHRDDADVPAPDRYLSWRACAAAGVHA